MSLKIDSKSSLDEIAKYMVKACKKMWALNDLICHFENDNGFNWKLRYTVFDSSKALAMPKTYKNIFKLLTDITEKNNSMVTYHRKPTKGEIKFGHGAMHYKDFPINEVINHKETKLEFKKWFICPIDKLRYYY